MSIDNPPARRAGFRKRRALARADAFLERSARFLQRAYEDSEGQLSRDWPSRDPDLRTLRDQRSEDWTMLMLRFRDESLIGEGPTRGISWEEAVLRYVNDIPRRLPGYPAGAWSNPLKDGAPTSDSEQRR